MLNSSRNIAENICIIYFKLRYYDDASLVNIFHLNMFVEDQVICRDYNKETMFTGLRMLVHF